MSLYYYWEGSSLISSKFRGSRRNYIYSSKRLEIRRLIRLFWGSRMIRLLTSCSLLFQNSNFRIFVFFVSALTIIWWLITRGCPNFQMRPSLVMSRHTRPGCFRKEIVSGEMVLFSGKGTGLLGMGSLGGPYYHFCTNTTCPRPRSRFLPTVFVVSTSHPLGCCH